LQLQEGGAVNTDLRDKLHVRMAASDRPWTAEEIARDALRIVSDAARAEQLVTAILGKDPRFERLPSSTWRARREPAPTLQDLAFLIAEIPPIANGEAPLFLQPYDPKQGRAGGIDAVLPEGVGLSRLVALREGRLLVSTSAPAVRRRLHQIEREHAVAASSERLLDLSACAKLVGVALPDPVARGNSATVDERMIASRELLDGILETIGAQSLDEVEARIEEGPGSREVDFSPFRFGREELDRIPSRPGLYRFHGEDGKLLYIGKSRDLHRRVGSYFRPLAPDHRRRASLLDAIRDLEWETTPSELEALLLESEAIRSSRPIFNQQVETHAESVEWSAADADLGFVLCEGDPDLVSAFFFHDRSPWARGRLPRAPLAGARQAALAIAEAWISGQISPDSGLVPLDEAGRALVVRFLLLHRDRIDRLLRADFVGLEGLAAALADLAVRERPVWEPWSLRGVVDPLKGENAAC
jgi:hypothetical protein